MNIEDILKNELKLGDILNNKKRAVEELVTMYLWNKDNGLVSLSDEVIAKELSEHINELYVNNKVPEIKPHNKVYFVGANGAEEIK